MSTTKQITGRGIFGWHGYERRSDRYGAFALCAEGYEGNGQFGNAGWDTSPAEIPGKRCQIKARVLEARDSGHIGDISRGISPTTPEAGEEIDLGAGVLFTTPWDFGLGVGLIPDDGRPTDWFDPEKLYRLHDQTVEITITVL